jgi:hypothetical protein
MACEDLQAKLDALNKRYAAAKAAWASEPKQEQTGAKAALNAIGAQVFQAQNELFACLHPQPQRVAGAQPENILGINFKNPPAFAATDDFATRIAGGTFPFKSGLEWKQVYDSDNEYDQVNLAGASGWAATPDLATNDTPGLHPFGFDWEFSFAVDTAYLFLLAQGNTNIVDGSTPPLLSLPNLPTNVINEVAGTKEMPAKGYLGVEWDSRLVPDAFQREVTGGDRVAVFGRWIIDCGHAPFHTEIHPPLLMASAAIYNEPSQLPGAHVGQFTRTVFTSRAFLVGQSFSVSTDANALYNDKDAGDGFFVEHLVNELRKVAEGVPLPGIGVIPLPGISSLQVEAHPKIKSNPFLGNHSLVIIVGAPVKPVKPGTLYNLAVSYDFTVRSGCSVTVAANDASSVKVVITMNSVGYTPPPLPNRNDQVLNGVSEINQAAGITFGGDLLAGLAVLAPAQAAILDRGLKTDQYDPLPAIFLQSAANPGSADAVIQSPVGSLTAGKGLTQDNTQPYPVYGWLELSWAAAQMSVSPH